LAVFKILGFMKSWTPKLLAELDAPGPERFELLTSGLPALPGAPMTLLDRLLLARKAGLTDYGWVVIVEV
jgi:hypothetical protein